MATKMGSATLDFGSSGGQHATTTVTGQTDIAAGDDIEVYFHGDYSTASYDTFAHRSVLPTVVSLVGHTITAATSFVITATSSVTLYGTIAVRWVRSTPV